MSTELDEAAIRARVEAATPGPWEVAEQSDRDWWGIQSEHFALASVFDHPNAEFIAHARTDLPAALDEITRLRAALDEARAEVEREREYADADTRTATEMATRALAAEKERDEARAAVERWKDDFGQSTEATGKALDERDALRAEVERLRSPERDTTGLTHGDKAAWRELISRTDAAESALAAVREWADELEREYGPETRAWRVFGPQVASIPFVVEKIRALATPTTTERSESDG